MNAIPQTTLHVSATANRWPVLREVNPQSVGHEPILTATWSDVEHGAKAEPVTAPSTLTEYEDGNAARTAARALSYTMPSAIAVLHDAKDRWFTTTIDSPSRPMFGLDPASNEHAHVLLAKPAGSLVDHVYGGGRDWTPTADPTAPRKTSAANALETKLPAELAQPHLVTLSWTNPENFDRRIGTSFGVGADATIVDGAVHVPGTMGDALLAAKAESLQHGAAAVLQAKDGGYWVTDVDPRTALHGHMSNAIAKKQDPALQAFCFYGKVFDFSGWL